MKNGKWLYYKENGEIKEITKHKPEKEITEAQKSRQIAITKKKYKKGYYIDSNNNTFHGYFFINEHNQVKFKSSSDKKGKPFYLKDIETITIATKRYYIIKKVNVKACSLNQKKENLLVSIRLEGDIILYSYNFICYSGSSTNFGPDGHNPIGGTAVSMEVFIVQKKNSMEFIEVRKRKKLFRELMFEITKDKPEILKEIDLENATYNDLIPIIQKYNSK